MRHAPVVPLITLAALACSAVPESLDGGRPDAPSRLTARIGGDAFTADSGQTQAIRFGPEWSVQGAQVRGVRPRLIVLRFTSVVVGEPLPLRPSSSFFFEAGAEGFFRIDSVQGGTVRLTRYDPINRRVAGTFEFVTRFYRSDPSGLGIATDSIIEIRDGAFDLDIETPRIVQ